jgi:Asp-tRNA(Asn)/Glu-tRNA(Gln) amidotransferase A subunit family amidase
LLQSACTLAAALRRGHVTSSQLVALCLARLADVNPQLNAVVHVRATEAKAHAAKCDEALRNGTAPPWPDAKNPQAALFGVPIVVKECFEVCCCCCPPPPLSTADS